MSMSQLDHLTISRVLGSNVQPYSRSPFGAFGAVRAVGEMLAWHPKLIHALGRDDSRDGKIVAAFTKVHDGYSADRVLADPAHAQRLVDEYHRLGLDQPVALLNRRLLCIRKTGSPTISLPKTTKTDKRNLLPYLIPAEIAYAQLSYRYDATIDDVIADPEIGAFFDDIAIRIGHGGSAIDYRLAALHLRKQVRLCKRSEKTELADFGEGELQHLWQDKGALAMITPNDVPRAEGIFALTEPTRYLFLTKYPNLRDGVDCFRDQRTVASLSNRFWTATPDRISVQVIDGTRTKGTTLRLLELKALEVYHPIFNLKLAA